MKTELQKTGLVVKLVLLFLLELQGAKGYIFVVKL